MAVQIPAQAIQDARAGAGELWQVVLAIAGPESSWRADAIGDNGCSIGYLQMNTCGGLGTGIPRETLLHGPTNMRLGAEYIRRRLATGASLWDALAPWSARPAAWELLQRIHREGVVPIGSASPMPIVPGGSTAGAAALLTVLLLVVLAVALD